MRKAASTSTVLLLIGPDKGFVKLAGRDGDAYPAPSIRGKLGLISHCMFMGSILKVLGMAWTNGWCRFVCSRPRANTSVVDVGVRHPAVRARRGDDGFDPKICCAMYKTLPVGLPSPGRPALVLITTRRYSRPAFCSDI